MMSATDESDVVQQPNVKDVDADAVDTVPVPSESEGDRPQPDGQESTEADKRNDAQEAGARANGRGEPRSVLVLIVV